MVLQDLGVLINFLFVLVFIFMYISYFLEIISVPLNYIPCRGTVYLWVVISASMHSNLCSCLSLNDIVLWQYIERSKNQCWNQGESLMVNCYALFIGWKERDMRRLKWKHYLPYMFCFMSNDYLLTFHGFSWIDQFILLSYVLFLKLINLV